MRVNIYIYIYANVPPPTKKGTYLLVVIHPILEFSLNFLYLLQGVVWLQEYVANIDEGESSFQPALVVRATDLDVTSDLQYR